MCFLAPWRGSGLRRCMCGIDHAQHRPSRRALPTSKRPVLVPVSARRSPGVVIMKSQPARSPPMRPVTSLGPWPPSAYAHRHRPSPIRPTSRTAPQECRNARRRETPRGGPRACRDPRVVLQLREPNFFDQGACPSHGLDPPSRRHPCR